jgi:hypothetical protein
VAIEQPLNEQHYLFSVQPGKKKINQMMEFSVTRLFKSTIGHIKGSNNSMDVKRRGSL